ncbi:MAG: SDR family NAD(P)-dependent oxidoreductase, partial [Chloroflexi bacterium]
MNMELEGKIAVISGGSIGIGLAVAEALAEEGVHLALCARDEIRVSEQAQAIAGKYGVRAIGVKTDVSKAEEIAAFVQKVEATFGGVDILINNAGTGSNETIVDAADEKWQYYWDL